MVNALPAGALRCEWAGEGEPVEVRVRATDPPCTDDLRVGIILEEWRVGAPVLIPPTSFSSDPEALGQLIDDVEDRRGRASHAVTTVAAVMIQILDIGV